MDCFLLSYMFVRRVEKCHSYAALCLVFTLELVGRKFVSFAVRLDLGPFPRLCCWPRLGTIVADALARTTRKESPF